MRLSPVFGCFGLRVCQFEANNLTTRDHTTGLRNAELSPAWFGGVRTGRLLRAAAPGFPLQCPLRQDWSGLAPAISGTPHPPTLDRPPARSPDVRGSGAQHSTQPPDSTSCCTASPAAATTSLAALPTDSDTPLCTFPLQSASTSCDTRLCPARTSSVDVEASDTSACTPHLRAVCLRTHSSHHHHRPKLHHLDSAASRVASPLRAVSRHISHTKEGTHGSR